MSVTMDDATGRPPSLQDIDDAIAATTKLAGPAMMMKIPPEVAVNVMNIRRCLVHLRSLLAGDRP